MGVVVRCDYVLLSFTGVVIQIHIAVVGRVRISRVLSAEERASGSAGAKVVAELFEPICIGR